MLKPDNPNTEQKGGCIVLPLVVESMVDYCWERERQFCLNVHQLISWNAPVEALKELIKQFKIQYK